MSRNLLLRIAVAVPAIAFTLYVVWYGGWLMGATLAGLGVLGTREVYDFARRQQIEPLAPAGYLAAAGIPIAAVWAKGSELHWAEPAIFLGAMWLLALLTIALTTRGPTGKPLSAVAVTVFGCLYASALPSFLVAIRHGAHSEAHPLASTALVVMPLAATWICDTAAMAAGTLFGGPKLAPVLSPNKTWAGAIGGLMGAVAATLAIGWLVLPKVALTLSTWQLVTLGVLVGVVAQLGDAAESLLKREVGLKDSSSLIPGHGGVLDRLDSLYFVIPAAAGLYRLFGLI
jgi:phosphatidate cytidylyltransferase